MLGSAFCFFLVFHSPLLATTNPQRRSGLGCSTNLSISQIHNVVLLSLTVLAVFLDSCHRCLISQHLLFADTNVSRYDTTSSNCWLLLAINLEPLPASRIPSGLAKSTARYTICETVFGSTGCLPSSCSDLLRNQKLFGQLSLSVRRLPANLTFA